LGGGLISRTSRSGGETRRRGDGSWEGAKQRISRRQERTLSTASLSSASTKKKSKLYDNCIQARDGEPNDSEHLTGCAGRIEKRVS